MRISASRAAVVRSTVMIVAALMLVCPAFAQHSNGKANITVLDPSKKVIQGAHLELQDLSTNEVRQADTSDAGTYTFPNLNVGNYKLTISKAGFTTLVVSPVVIDQTQTTDVPVQLEVGAASETVEVKSQAPALQTTSNAINTTISSKEIEDLPLAGRNLTAFATYSSGYSGPVGGGGTWNGLPVIAEGNNIDGVISSPARMKFGGNSAPAVQPRLEAIEEMTTQTDMLDLNTGYGQGAMQLNFVTRRGSNNYHGRVFENFRNSYLFANSWRNDALGIKKPVTIFNDFGGSVGGPIFHDKLFFFGSYAMSKQPGTVVATNNVLTAAAQAGNFTYVSGGTAHVVNVFQLAQNCATCGTNMPTTVNPVTASLQGAVNNALSGGTISTTTDPNLNSLSFLVPNPITTYYPAARVDYAVTKKLRANLAWNETKSITPTANAAFFPGSNFANTAAGNWFNNYTVSLGIDYTVSPTLINSFRAGYLYTVSKFDYNAKPLYAQLPQVYWNYPSAAGSMSGQSGYFTPISSFYPVFDFSDTITWQRGSHSFNFGGSAWREQDWYWNGPLGFPNINLGIAAADPAINAFTISGAGATLPGANTTQQSQAESLYALLTGRVTSAGNQYPYDPKSKQYKQEIGAYNLNELTKAWGLYFQDAWRIKPSLTLNYGLRWDFTGDDHDLGLAYHQAWTDSVLGPTASGELFTPGALNGNPSPQLVVHPHVYNPWNVSPQPAFGFAWNPGYSSGILAKILGGNSTVIRGGYALRKFTEPFQYFWNNASDFGSFFYQNFGLSTNGSGVGTFAPGSLNLTNAGATTQPCPTPGATQCTSFQGMPYFFSPTAFQNTVNESQFTFIANTPGVNGFEPNIRQPYTQSYNLGIQRSFGASRALEIRYNGNRVIHQWININNNEVNIFENGFLTEFQNAQKNLAINQAAGVNSFANRGLAGQVNLPLFSALFAGESLSGGFAKDFSNGTFINTDLLLGQAGDMARRLSGVGAPGQAAYLCNLVGPSFTPCVTNITNTSPVNGNPWNGTGTINPATGQLYPINFFQANPYAAGSSTGLLTDLGFSNYNSLQVDFRQRAWHGVQFDANYTYAHTLGVSTPDDWTGAYTAFTLRDLRRSYGPSLFDLRHVVHLTGTADLPLGRGHRWLNRGGVVDRIVGGWNVGTILTYQTGFPSLVTGASRRTFNNIADGGVNLNGVTPEQLQAAVGVFHVTAAQNGGNPATIVDLIDPQFLAAANGGGAKNTFLTPNTVPGTIANSFYIYGPHGFYDDMSVTKNFNITERFRFNLQAELLNAFNHPTFGNSGGPNANILSSGFMTGGTNGSARRMEIRANFEF